ncbi:hypothetical protein FB451DRAFT_1256090 [Mycena latifolia]|nr:hypothetical protein FB451DRAFT_1256090 [Mycena latifolia]
MADLDSSPNEHNPPLSAEAELGRIDEEIRRLEARRSALLTPVQVYRVALATHKILPDDVLREIFLWATCTQYYWGPPTANLNATLSGDPNVRLVIGRVSSHWRFVSLDMPELWSDVRVEIPPLVALAGSMDLLERFDVQAHYASIPDASISVLSRSPRLCSVTLCSLSEGYPLTELHLEGMPTGVLQSYHILAQCTALTCAPSATFAQFLDGVTLPSLTELILYGPEGWGPQHSTMYTIDTFPAVRRLIVHNVDYDEDGDPEWLVPWFRSCPSAVDVRLPGYRMPTPLLTQIADGSLLPNLEMILLQYAELPSLLAALQARQRSLNHSTITTVGIREYSWYEEAPNEAEDRLS